MTNDETEPTRGAGVILASFLCLAALLGIFLKVASAPSPTVELEEVLGGLEMAPEPSHGLTSLAVEKTAKGRLIAHFGDPADLPPSDEMGEMAVEMGRGMGGRGMRGMGGMDGMDGGKPDPNSPWPKLPDGETGQAPWQMTLVHYPSSEKAEETLSNEFGRLHFKDLATLPKHGGKAVVDSGHVVWHGFRLPYVRTRHFRKQDKEPVFHDSMRINLTMDRHALVLYMRWRPGQLGHAEEARPMLDSLSIKPKDD